MQNLTELIASSDLFQVELEVRPIVRVISVLNDYIKQLNRRIMIVEQELKLFVRQADHDRVFQSMSNKIENLDERTSSLSAKISGIAGDLKATGQKLEQLIDERSNEVLISSTMKTQSAVSGVESQINIVDSQLKQLKDQVESMEKNKTDHKGDINVIAMQVKQNKDEIEKLKKTVGDNRYKLFDMQKMIERRQGSEQKNSDNDDKMNLAAISFQDDLKVDQGIATSELNMLNQKNEEKINELQKHVDILQSNFRDHKNKVIIAMKAIQFELQTIRDYGKGLEGLPLLSLHDAVPEFFDVSRPAFPPGFGDPRPDNDEEEKKKQKEKRRQAQQPSIVMINKHSYPKNKSSGGSRSNSERESPRVKFKQEPVIIQQSIDVEEIMEKLRKEFNVPEIRSLIEQTKKDHENLLSTIERKIDRDYVERLFDKFRVIVHGINDRVKELAELNHDNATHQDLQVLVQLLKNLPTESRPATAVKKGPRCLFCNRPKTSLAGEISPRTASKIGSPPVSRVTNEGSNIDFIYGDGQAYRRDENFQSFPHFDLLPPLPEGEKNSKK